MNVKDLLEKVARGRLTTAQALAMLTQAGESNLGFARVDTDRLRRRGLAEVIFCPGKNPRQIVAIMAALKKARQNILATRVTPEQYAVIRKAFPKAVLHEAARSVTLDVVPLPPKVGLIAVVTAGTTDIPVAEEAALVAERMGARVERLYDVGIAGLHRVLKHVDLLHRARALVVVAGLEGALPSVIGGLTDRPIIAVPTSIGYGTSMHGMAALLAMLNSCVPGISVVNIDNGFGAGVAAALVNRVAQEQPESAAAGRRQMTAHGGKRGH
jgi:pyridinium-3,5-biscarboxylic acid mononucleotide synthase